MVTCRETKHGPPDYGTRTALQHSVVPFMIIHAFHSVARNNHISWWNAIKSGTNISFRPHVFRVTILGNSIKFQNSKAQTIMGNWAEQQYAPTHKCVGSRMHYSRVPPLCSQDMGVCMQDRAAADSEMGTVVSRTACGSYSDVCPLVPL